MRLRHLLFVTLAAASVAAAASREEKVLNVFTWPDYIGPNVIADFEKEYGIKVNYDTYDSTEMAEARLLAGRTGYDVVDHAERYSARLIPIGVYRPLDRAKLPKATDRGSFPPAEYLSFTRDLAARAPGITELARQLAAPRPADARTIAQLGRYKGLDARWTDWTNVTDVCRSVAVEMVR